MSTKQQNQRIIFGLKVKQLRNAKQLSFKQLSEKAGVSISYINEIEKGKKYPKEDKLRSLADALEVSVEELTSPELSHNLAPVNDLLNSNFLNELPLDLFGIELAKVVEIIANAPSRVGAFISTLVELARNYALREENFYLGAMRAYQEMHYNYFEEIETAAANFVREHKLPVAGPVPAKRLAEILEDEYNYRIVVNGLKNYPELKSQRSVFVSKRKKLLLNGRINAYQKIFQFGKELGFNYLNLKDRAYTASLMRAEKFEDVINHFKAASFAVSILINKESFIKDLQHFFQRKTWDSDAFLEIMHKYQAAPEMYFNRLVTLIPHAFGLDKLFSLRLIYNPKDESFHINKELHFNRRHHPHSNLINEHYCRRWQSLALLKTVSGLAPGEFKVGVQRSHYYGTNDEYLCFTIARPAYEIPSLHVSVTIGILLDDESKSAIHFWDDPAIPIREVNNTCERCPITDCKERAVPATVIEKRDKRRKMEEALQRLLKM